jgi:hypothetical protein
VRNQRRCLFQPALRLAAVSGLVAAVLFAADIAPGQAQSPLSISVPPTITIEPATQAAFSIRVAPAEGLPRNSFVRVRGLPPMAGISDGYSIAPGAWAIPLAALPNLKLTIPAGASGRSEVTIMLVAIDGAVLAQAKSTLIVSSPQQAPGTQPQRGAGQEPATASILRATPVPATPSTPETTPSAPTALMTPEDRERASRLMKKGDQQMEEGNISAARLLYERAANAGLPQAAMALAATFDATELANMRTRGIQPDRKEARRWYERARQLGASGAEARLQRLGAN